MLNRKDFNKMATKSFASLSKAQKYMKGLKSEAQASLESITLKGGLILHVITWQGSTGESVRIGLTPECRTYAEKNIENAAVAAFIKARDELESLFAKLSDKDPGKQSAIAAFNAVKAKRDSWRESANFGKGGKVVPSSK